MGKYILKVRNEGMPWTTLTSDDSLSLLENLRIGGFFPDAPCGGLGKCGKCTVTVSGKCRGADGKERIFENDMTPACSVYPAGKLDVTVAKTTGEKVLTGDRNIGGGGHGLGLAVDIGTTTVAVYLYDLSSGDCIGSIGKVNEQAAYGADVISRIQFASSEDGLNTLSSVIRKQITVMAAQICGDLKAIRYISIAGNTVMEHLFAGISPESIGTAPYEPESLFGIEYSADNFFNSFSNECRLFLCPAVAGFVGGDITAGILGTGAYNINGNCLFIDIGTNGEIVMGGSDGFFCCSAAAGPAFEGGETECGSPARVGAISTVDDDLNITVIGGGQPESICGSGLIDVAAAFLKNGIIDETGRLNCEKYIFGNGVYLSGSDIRKLQMAKAAIRAGIDTLMELSGKTYSDISEVMISGGFGAAMNVKSACAIGLLPAELERKTRYVGNASGLGASMALLEEHRETIKKISAACRYEELTVSPVFSEKYINSMTFGEPDVDFEVTYEE